MRAKKNRDLVRRRFGAQTQTFGCGMDCQTVERINNSDQLATSRRVRDSRLDFENSTSHTRQLA